MENTFDFYNAQYSDLLNEALRLNALVSELKTNADTVNNKLLYTEKAFENRERQFKSARILIQEIIEEEYLTEEDYIKQLVELFDIEIMREVAFNLTITVSGITQIPLGSELEESMFEVDGISYNGDSISIDYESTHLEEWTFTE